ncbi:MAG: hypothetical protein Q9223_002112 [Gallowayella weberi]
MKDIIQDFVSAMDDLHINQQPVRSYYRARYGSWPANEDRDRIIARLRKTRDTRREELKREFFGPSGRIPHGRHAFLYQQLEHNYYSHEECIQAFRIADNWNSSDENLSETVSLDSNQYVSPEDTMREWYGGVQQNAVQFPEFTGYSSSETSEQGEYFRSLYQHRRGGAFGFRQEMESLSGSESNTILHLDEQLGLESQISSGSSTDGTDSVMQAADVPTDADRHSGQGPQELSEQVSERLRARLDQLDVAFNAAAVQISSVMDVIEGNNPQTRTAAAPVTDTSGNPRQSHFRENLSDVGEHSTYGNPSTMSNLELDESTVQQRRLIEGLRDITRRALQRLVSFGTQRGR